jgi:hypothetical protein
MTFSESKIDADKEELIPLSQVPNLPFVPRRRRGRKLSISSVYRWAKDGVGPNNIRLETVQFGGTKCTTVRKLHEFFKRLGGPEKQDNRRDEPSHPNTMPQVEAELAAEGF